MEPLRTDAESNRSDRPFEKPHGHQVKPGDYSDAITGAGVVLITIGAGLFHIGAAVVIFGLALVIIGTRGHVPGG